MDKIINSINVHIKLTLTVLPISPSFNHITQRDFTKILIGQILIEKILIGKNYSCYYVV